MIAERYGLSLSEAQPNSTAVAARALAGSRMPRNRKAAAMDVSISDVVNEAVKQTLSEDAADLEVFEKRRREPALDFEDVVRALKRSGKL